MTNRSLSVESKPTAAVANRGVLNAAPRNPLVSNRQTFTNAITKPLLQPKLKVGAPNDKYEQEADRVAERVVSAPEPGGVTASASPLQIQRLCPQCEEELQREPQEEEDEGLIQAQAHSGRQSEVSPSTAAGINAMKSGGQPLSEAERNFFEPRFGYNFSRVKIHADAEAARAAQSVQARAFTWGQHIVFANGYYSPKTLGGKRLIAHELAHTIQQGAASESTIQRDGEPGTTRFEDTVHGTPTETAPDIWEGEVDRREYIPATGSEAERTIHTGRVGLQFNRSTCAVTIPFKVGFEHPSATNWPRCEGDADRDIPEHLPDDRFNEISGDFITASRTWLNGWYTARVEGCERACSGREIPINVEVTRDDSDPDWRVVLANIRGRSCVSGDVVTIHTRGPSGGGASTHRLAHEAGHAVLQHGDEYRDEDRPVERVRTTDWSLMASHDLFGRRSLLHERHFAFVPPFLEAVMPGCTASLVELSRPLNPSFELSLNFGASFYEGGGGISAGLGFDVGLPLDRMREWELLIGAHGQVISRLEGAPRMAYLLGLRLGLEHTTTPSAGGFRAGGFAELGYGWFGRDVPGGRPWESRTEGSPYGELGIFGGYSAATEGVIPFISAEIAAGTAFEGMDFSDLENSENARWFRAGLLGGLRF